MRFVLEVKHCINLRIKSSNKLDIFAKSDKTLMLRKYFLLVSLG